MIAGRAVRQPVWCDYRRSGFMQLTPIIERIEKLIGHQFLSAISILLTSCHRNCTGWTSSTTGHSIVAESFGKLVSGAARRNIDPARVLSGQ